MGAAGVGGCAEIDEQSRRSQCFSEQQLQEAHEAERLQPFVLEVLEGRLTCTEAAQQASIWISKMHDAITQFQNEYEDWPDEVDRD